VDIDDSGLKTTTQEQESKEPSTNKRKKGKKKKRFQTGKINGTISVVISLQGPNSSYFISCSELVEFSNKMNGKVSTREGVVNIVVETMEENIRNIWDCGGNVDEFTMDQIIIYMCLARGVSRVIVGSESAISSQHLTTALHFASTLSGVEFSITNIEYNLPQFDQPEVTISKDCRVIECNGIGKELGNY